MLHLGAEVLALSVAAVVSSLSTFVTNWRGRRLKEETQQEADRLESVIFDQADSADGPVDDRSTVVGQAHQHFTRLLVQYYAHGLVQARRSFSMSLTYSALGGLVLLTGVGLAIFRAESTGDVYASITASVAGLLTTCISILFHRRADAALAHLEKQSTRLQPDMKAERDAAHAMRLLEEVRDPALKAQLQAALILKFSRAQLPHLPGSSADPTGVPPPRTNGTAPQAPAEEAPA